MINSVNFNPKISQSRQKTDAPVTQPSFEGNREMSPEISNAYRAYGQAMVNKPLEQLSFNDCILQLQKQGKVEGKDYKLENYECGRTAIYLLNKNGQETKRMLFLNEGKIDCWEDFKYSDTRKIKTIYHDANGKIPNYQDYYYNDEIPQEAFTKEKINFNTNPYDYLEYLKENNINFKVEYGPDNINKIEEFDENNKLVQDTIWYQDENYKLASCERNIYNENEDCIKNIDFKKNQTIVNTRLEKWSKGKSYLRKDVPQETFTPEHITAETTADEYIQCLKENNKKFEILNQKDWTLIKEFDDNGKEIQSTGFEKDKFGPYDTLVMRREYLENGNSKRISFSKTDTYIENFYYD